MRTKFGTVNYVDCFTVSVAPQPALSALSVQMGKTTHGTQDSTGQASLYNPQLSG